MQVLVSHPGTPTARKFYSLAHLFFMPFIGQEGLQFPVVLKPGALVSGLCLSFFVACCVGSRRWFLRAGRWLEAVVFRSEAPFIINVIVEARCSTCCDELS